MARVVDRLADAPFPTNGNAKIANAGNRYGAGVGIGSAVAWGDEGRRTVVSAPGRGGDQDASQREASSRFEIGNESCARRECATSLREGHDERGGGMYGGFAASLDRAIVRQSPNGPSSARCNR